jgi:hypothetical protein
MLICEESTEKVIDMINSLSSSELDVIELNDKDVPEHMNQEGLRSFIAFSDGESVGFFCGWSVGDYVQTPIFVKKDQRGKGYGKGIVKLAEQTLKGNCFHRIKNSNDKMMKLSKSCGYEPVQELDGYSFMIKRGL